MCLFCCGMDGSGVTSVNGAWIMGVWFSWVKKYILCIGRAWMFGLTWLGWGETDIYVMCVLLKGDSCFGNECVANATMLTLHDSGVVLLPSTGGHLSVCCGGVVSSDLVCSFFLEVAVTRVSHYEEFLYLLKHGMGWICLMPPQTGLRTLTKYTINRQYAKYKFFRTKLPNLQKNKRHYNIWLLDIKTWWYFYLSTKYYKIIDTTKNTRYCINTRNPNISTHKPTIKLLQQHYKWHMKNENKEYKWIFLLLFSFFKINDTIRWHFT